MIDWISVKNRLPEKHGWYLTAHKKTYPTDSGMKICFFCYGYFTTDKEVTHWRPLPEYPESEDDAENGCMKEASEGEWIIHFDDLFPEESTQECSICHAEQYLRYGDDDNYCPNCGAKMKQAGKG